MNHYLPFLPRLLLLMLISACTTDSRVVPTDDMAANALPVGDRVDSPPEVTAAVPPSPSVMPPARSVLDEAPPISIQSVAMPTTSPLDPPTTHEVTVPEGRYVFLPRELTIYEGDSVRWANGSGIIHPMASILGPEVSGAMEIESQELPVDGSLTHTFHMAGNYPYFCFVHNRMTGRIIVLSR